MEWLALISGAVTLMIIIGIKKLWKWKLKEFWTEIYKEQIQFVVHYPSGKEDKSEFMVYDEDKVGSFFDFMNNPDDAPFLAIDGKKGSFIIPTEVIKNNAVRIIYKKKLF